MSHNYHHYDHDLTAQTLRHDNINTVHGVSRQRELIDRNERQT